MVNIPVRSPHRRRTCSPESVESPARLELWHIIEARILRDSNPKSQFAGQHTGSIFEPQKSILMTIRHSFAISSLLRQNRSNKEGLAPVYLRITCNRKRSEISVRVLVDPAKWNSAKGRVKGNSEDIRRLNQSIETFEHRAREIYNKYILTGQLITADRIKNELLGLNMPVHYVVKEFEKFVREIECMKRPIGHF